ncbi:MAG: site-specific integrase [Weeksellaceae bacterium]|nr:site-specific integrase [Bacteroidota bacterium]MCG2780787.1 site-specific integrase [Weeksellaceae bacterium]
MKNTKIDFNPDLYDISLGEHAGKEIIWLRFPYEASLVLMLKSNSRARWSRTQKSWYIPDNQRNRLLCNLKPKNIGKQALSKIHPVNLPAFNAYHDQLVLKGFSANTIRTYTTEFAQLLYLLHAYPVEELSAEKLQSYFLYCHRELGLSENLIHSRMNALKFYFEKVLHRSRIFFDIPRPKKPQLLPKALNTKEVSKIIAVTENPKHRLIIQLCYGMGLRVSEIVNLRVQDIDSGTMRVFISRAKGKKDRYVNLPETILQDLRTYYKEHRPKEYLFEGKYNEQYSVRSAQNVFKTAMNKAGIIKTVGIHSLRHSYATHLLQCGTDITLIQKLMGHQDMKTTLAYTHVTDRNTSAVKSPLDRLMNPYSGT